MSFFARLFMGLLLTGLCWAEARATIVAPPSQGLARTLTWPGSAGIMLTCADALGRVTQIKEAADCTTATGRLVLYGYDDLSRRTAITRANGAGTSLSYQDTGALDTLAHSIGGGGSVTSSFGYNRALQITSRTTDNDLYAWTNHYNVTRTYAPNGLDQYGQIMGDAMAWDARGNLAAYRGVSYGYDGENRLAAAAMSAGTATTAYDPAGRLRQIGAAVTSQFLYDGDAPIAEYNAASGAIITRFVPGPGTDETAVAYDAGGAKSWYHADAQGSVIATSDGSGNVATINQYGPFGEPGLVYQGRNAGRIRYTGQIALPELAPYGGPAQPLYSFKARIYAPKLGRFLQTDPIGAQDDRNLYAYVGNDPLNRIDPTGLAAEAVGNAFRSGDLVPGGRGALQAYSQYQQGNYGSAAANFVGGLAEAGLAVGTLGEGAAALRAGTAVTRAAEGVAASGGESGIPSTLVRVIPGRGPYPTLGPPGATDVFVTTPEAIAGLGPAGIAERLTIPPANEFTVIRLPTPEQGLASPVFRSNPGFIGGGRTAWGAPEYVIPNGPVPPGSTTTVVRP